MLGSIPKTPEQKAKDKLISSVTQVEMCIQALETFDKEDHANIMKLLKLNVEELKFLANKIKVG